MQQERPVESRGGVWEEGGERGTENEGEGEAEEGEMYSEIERLGGRA